MINDVSALRADPEMVSVAKNHNCEIVLMHSASDGPLPHAPQKNVRTYKDVVTEIAQFLLLRAEFALSKGVAADKIILDPGCGTFISSNPDHSWQLLREMGRFVEAVRPFTLNIGVSRKGFLGGELTHRDPISQLVAVAAVEKGASYVRTHNPGMMSAFLDATARL
jgi:dihydropteroate synthase